MLIFYFVISYRLLKKKSEISRKRLIFSIYYLFSLIGIVLNYIYAPIKHKVITSLLYLITIYVIYVGTNFLAIFSIIMYFEIKDNSNTTKIQLVYLVVFSSLYLVLFFIPDGIMINEETGWYPVVNLTFFIYCTILVTISLLVVVAYSIKTLYIFRARNENKTLITRWKIYVLGMTITITHATIVMFVHHLDYNPLREIWSILGGFIFITGIYLTWFGIGKKFLQ